MLTIVDENDKLCSVYLSPKDSCFDLFAYAIHMSFRLQGLESAALII